MKIRKLSPALMNQLLGTLDSGFTLEEHVTEARAWFYDVTWEVFSFYLIKDKASSEIR